MIAAARIAANDILLRVEDGAYASDLLITRTADLASRDAGLAGEIVFGALRRRAQLDHLIEKTAKRSVTKLDPEVRTILRMGAYQLRHLERVPGHAVVDDAVELAKAARKRSAAPFVNAILRRLPRGEVAWPTREIELSMPEWLLARWTAHFGSDVAATIAREFLKRPETYVRNPPPREGLVLEPTDIPGGYRVIEGDLTGLRIQDVGSQSVVPLLDLRPGQTFLDLCAAPGNKTAQALETVVNGIACDLHWHRVKNVSGCARVVLDATRPLPFASSFDRVLVDAPCSGTGTLGRNPEIRWRIQPKDLVELQAKQIAICGRALDALKPGGKLVYSTCSLETIENEDVVDQVRQTAGVELLSMSRRTPGLDPGDGFFAAVFQRT